MPIARSVNRSPCKHQRGKALTALLRLVVGCEKPQYFSAFVREIPSTSAHRANTFRIDMCTSTAPLLESVANCPTLDVLATTVHAMMSQYGLHIQASLAPTLHLTTGRIQGHLASTLVVQIAAPLTLAELALCSKTRHRQGNTLEFRSSRLRRALNSW